MSAGIHAQQLSKRYAKGAWAIAELDLEIAPGEIFGLLGPNGAGKTTVVRVLTTLLKPTSGSVTVAGYDVVRQSAEVRKQIAVVAQDACLDCMLTVRDNLDFYAKLHGLRGGRRQEQIGAALHWANLEDKANLLVDTLSGGMKRKLDLVRVMMFHPPSVFLDEPTAGLDPASRRGVWHMIGEMRNSGCTVVLTTHYMEEAARLCDRLAILHHGRCVAEGTPNEITSRLGGNNTLQVHVSQLTDVMLDPLVRSGVIQKYALVGNYHESVAHLYLDDGLSKMPQVLRYLEEQGLSASAVTLQGPTLEDAFIQLTGQRIEE